MVLFHLRMLDMTFTDINLLTRQDIPMTVLQRCLMAIATYFRIAAHNSRVAKWMLSTCISLGNSEVCRIRWIAINKTVNISSIHLAWPMLKSRQFLKRSICPNSCSLFHFKLRILINEILSHICHGVTLWELSTSAFFQRDSNNFKPELWAGNLTQGRQGRNGSATQPNWKTGFVARMSHGGCGSEENLTSVHPSLYTLRNLDSLFCVAPPINWRMTLVNDGNPPGSLLNFNTIELKSNLLKSTI
jgi:hypothetical protein